MKLLAARDYTAACELLAPGLHATLSPDNLGDAFLGMWQGYADRPLIGVQFDEERGLMTDWPAKGDGNVEWAYVGVNGADFNEGVSVVVEDAEGHAVDQEVEWGRP